MRRAAWGPALVWAMGLAAVTTVGLGLLTWGLMVMHALVYGVAGVIGQGVVEAVDLRRYGVAFGVGAGVNLLGAALLVRLASRTPLRGWPPAGQGAAAAAVSAVVALWALLRIVGIGLLDFVSGLVG